MFPDTVTTFSTVETMVGGPKTMFPALLTLVWTIQTMIIVVETTVGVTQTLFSEAEPIFFASEMRFSIMEKTGGELPAAYKFTIVLSQGTRNAHQGTVKISGGSWNWNGAADHPEATVRGGRAVGVLNRLFKKAQEATFLIFRLVGS